MTLHINYYQWVFILRKPRYQREKLSDIIVSDAMFVRIAMLTCSEFLFFPEQLLLPGFDWEVEEL
jgi:hypothetical protein